jgi:hypothetical protein
MTTEEFIRDCAARNWSRTQTHQALGISRPKFNLILEHMPDVKWPAPGKSAANYQAYREARGQCSPARRAALIRNRKMAAVATYEVDGRVGTVDELAVHSPVSAGTIRRRLSLGVPPEQAFTKPATPLRERRNGSIRGSAA